MTRSLTRRTHPFVVPFGTPFGDFDALVRSAFGPAGTGSPVSSGFAAPADVVRDGEDAVIHLDLPGVDVENDVTVEVQNGRLVVRGERKSSYSSDDDTRSVREVRYGSFQRSFALPAGITADAISASYDAGVLTVRVTGAYAGTTAQRIAISS